MFKSSFQNIVLAVILLIPSVVVSAQTVTEPKTKAEWSQPYKPFRIAGNLYYVGTYDLACYLITTTGGNILINTGLAASAAQIKSKSKPWALSLLIPKYSSQHMHIMIM